MKIQIPAKAAVSKAETLKWLVENKEALIAQKKSEIKEADAIGAPVQYLNEKGEPLAEKAGMPVTPTLNAEEIEAIKVQLVINTTKVMDSHSDVHFDGLWKKTISENPMVYLCREHNLTFEGIISDKVTVSTKSISWKSLGADYPGNTQALIFDCLIEKDRNEYMFDQYCKGYVKNHSIRMQYVKIYLCIDDKDYANEYDNWQKYFPEVVNGDEAKAQGYFWAVTEAKIAYEGSACPVGSNKFTPPRSISADNGAEKDVEIRTKQMVMCPDCEQEFDSPYCPGCGTTQDSCKPKNAHLHKNEPPPGTQTKQYFYNPNL